jgi:alanine dehydrogenase
MVVGVPKEIKEGENRVAATPAGVHVLVAAGHRVLVQRGAGRGSGIGDPEYRKAGAVICESAPEVWGEAEMVLKVKEPLPEEYGFLRPGLVVFTYLHLASDAGLIRTMLDASVIAVGYETVETADGRLPLLVPMSEVAGRLGPQIAARYLETDYGGRGILLAGAPGVPPADVVIIGCGTVGINAAYIAVGMGAQVAILDINHERLKYLDDVMHGRVITIYSTPLNVARTVQYADVVLGTVLVPGARAPVVVTEEMVASMKRGAVIVDVSVDQGGCVATTRPTTHGKPTFKAHGVIHYGVPNMPGAVPRTATFALTNATLPYALKLANLGVERALEQDESLRRGLNLWHGEIRHAGVTEAYEAAGG